MGRNIYITDIITPGHAIEISSIGRFWGEIISGVINRMKEGNIGDIPTVF
jgi:hypothetical protein